MTIKSAGVIYAFFVRALVLIRLKKTKRKHRRRSRREERGEKRKRSLERGLRVGIEYLNALAAVVDGGGVGGKEEREKAIAAATQSGQIAPARSRFPGGLRDERSHMQVQ